jgi:hypothetical protein
MSEASHKRWTVLFRTKDDMTHPIRITNHEPLTEEEARTLAGRYAYTHRDWLSGIEDIYPTAHQPSHLTSTPNHQTYEHSSLPEVRQVRT